MGVKLVMDIVVMVNFFEGFIYLFLERGEGREKERERNIDQVPLTPSHPGTWLTTQTCTPTENQTSDLYVCRMMPNP